MCENSLYDLSCSFAKAQKETSKDLQEIFSLNFLMMYIVYFLLQVFFSLFDFANLSWLAAFDYKYVFFSAFYDYLVFFLGIFQLKCSFEFTFVSCGPTIA